MVCRYAYHLMLMHICVADMFAYSIAYVGVVMATIILRYIVDVCGYSNIGNR